MKRNVLMRIEYDGSDFHGWQIQPAARTVQGEIEKALTVICREDIRIHGASRTDAGVHAFGQAASFTGNFGIPAEKIPIAVNGLLDGIRIISAEEKPEGFHARYDSVGKRYRYMISVSDPPDIFMRNYRYQLNERPNQSKMVEASVYLVGTHDFRAFRSAGSNGNEDTVKTITGIRIDSDVPDEMMIEVTGNGFLYNMVRIITGTLLEVGFGKIEPSEVKAILESGDRSKAGYTAPAAGLFLQKVYFDPIEFSGVSQAYCR